MAATITFDAAAFRAQFPEFANTQVYTDATLSVRFDTASLYISNKVNTCWGAMSTAQRTQALLLMTAHLQAISDIIARGNTPGVMTQATVDKVSVTMEPPPADNQWQYWLQTTAYGQQLFALLQASSVGGLFVGGVPEIFGLRRGYGYNG